VNAPLQIGRYFLALPIIAFGIQYFLYGRFVGGLPPVPPWTPGGAIGAYLVGAFLVATGITITIDQKARWSALLPGSVFLLCVIAFHGPRMHDLLVDDVARTRALEPLALSGAAFVLGGFLSDDRTISSSTPVSSAGITRWGHCLFALPMVIFGVQQFSIRASDRGTHSVMDSGTSVLGTLYRYRPHRGRSVDHHPQTWTPGRDFAGHHVSSLGGSSSCAARAGVAAQR